MTEDTSRPMPPASPASGTEGAPAGAPPAFAGDAMAVSPGGASGPAAGDATTPSAAVSDSRSSRQHYGLLLLVVAVVLLGWQWYEIRQDLAETRDELARRLSDNDSTVKEGRQLARQAQEQLGALQARQGTLEGRLAESESQQAVLESMYQDLARNRDESVVAEIEQGVMLAAQQLQLAGNVQGAVLALQAADARLSGATSPRFIALRKAFVRDLDRLRTLPRVDLPGMSARLDSIITVIDALPLAVDVRPQAVVPPETPEAAIPLWQRMLIDGWAEIKSLVRIQRFDRDEPVLLAPGQVFFLRENIKLRLLNARLSMLMRDQQTFRNELKASLALFERHFDTDDKAVRVALDGLRQLGSAELQIELPTLNESLSAIQSFKAVRDRGNRDPAK